MLLFLVDVLSPPESLHKYVAKPSDEILYFECNSFFLCVCCALVVSDGGDHALLSSELTAIIHGILLAGGKLCALYGATRIDCASFFPQKSKYYLLSCCNMCCLITCASWTLLIKLPFFFSGNELQKNDRCFSFFFFFFGEHALHVRNDAKSPANALIEGKCGCSFIPETKENPLYLVPPQPQHRLSLSPSKFVGNNNTALTSAPVFTKKIKKIQAR